jgi:hypothetical protein
MGGYRRSRRLIFGRDFRDEPSFGIETAMILGGTGQIS